MRDLQPQTTTQLFSATVEANGTTIFYRRLGEGPPLVMLHGNGEDGSIFLMAAERLSKKYTVILPDSRGHGKSGTAGRLTYADMAEDVYQLLTLLDLNQVVFYGFSDGGIVGLMLTLAHPDIVSKLIISGANLSPKGYTRAFRAWLLFQRLFHNTNLVRLMATQPNINPAALKTITQDVLVLAGEHDIIQPRHTLLIADSLPNATLRIVHGEDHASYVLDHEKLVSLLLDYLK